LLKRLSLCLLVVTAISFSTRDAAAADFNFHCITNDSADNCAALEDQLLVTIGLNETNSSMVDFLFTNSGPVASSLTDVYFDDGPPSLLTTPLLISSSAGVAFEPGCSPGNLPGGTPAGFASTYCADSNAPTQSNGVNPGEWLRLSYTLQGDATLAAVLNAISNGDFRIGIHVQGINNEGSESGLINPQPVPEPASLVLLGSGAAAAFLRRRRKLA
jgi:PEP-CTERM motif